MKSMMFAVFICLIVFTATQSPSTNALYVDTINGLDTNTGQITSPFQTIQAAVNQLTQLTSYSSFVNPIYYSYTVHVLPGIYASEPSNTITIGDGLTYTPPPIITFILYGAKIMANIVYNSNGAITTSGSPLQQTQLVITDRNLKAYNDGSTPITGVNGTITINGSGSNTVVVEITQTAVLGAFTVVNNGTGTTCRLYLSNAYMQNIITIGTAAIALHAEHSPPDSKYGLGSLIGNIALTKLNDVVFASAASLSGNTGNGIWYNTQFAAGSTSSNSGVVSTDANSLASYLLGFSSSLGSYSFTYGDNTQGIAYSPTSPSNWSPSPTTAQGALDALAANLAALTAAVAALPVNPNLQITVTLTSSQLLNLHTTPVLLITAPGLGYYIYTSGYTMQYHFGGSAYSSPLHTNDCFFTYGSTLSPGPTNIAMLYNWAATGSGIIEATASSTFTGVSGDSVTPYTNVGNAGLYFYAPNALTGGNGALSITINYSILPLL